MKVKPAVTVQEVVEVVGGKIIGNPQQKVNGLNEIHVVENGDLTFVDHPKYYDKVLHSRATIILINKETEAPEGKTLIVSNDPFSAYVKLVNTFHKFIPSVQMVSESAAVGEGSVIQHGAFVGNNVSIGKNCLIHSNVSIYDNTIIGDNVIIHSNSVLGADAFYFKRRPDYHDKLVSCGRVVIEDNVEIGALCTIDKGVSGDTIIGWGSKLDNHIQVAHDTVVGKNCLFATAVIIAGCTRIEDDVILWGRVSVQKDIVIGKGAVLLATSSVDKNLEGNKVYFGTPAEEARKKWKELALIKKLPEIYRKVNTI